MERKIVYHDEKFEHLPYFNGATLASMQVMKHKMIIGSVPLYEKVKIVCLRLELHGI